MALINNIYVFVDGDGEEINRGVDSSTHPVEKGISLTDTVRNKPIEVSLKGKIVDTKSLRARDTISKIISLMKSGSLVTYTGRNVIGNLQIQSFNTNHPNTICGGCQFDMTLKQVRIAKNSYSVNSNTNTKSKTTTPTKAKISVGSIVVFLGGNVYVSSDAKNAAANRGRSTCKVTSINNATWAKHKYHLISTDGKMVYGWVDESNIQTTSNSTTNSKSKSGTKQVTNGSKKAVYHTVKQGNTVWGLVNNNYKSLDTSVEWVIKNNPKAFSRKGDPTTLQVGAKLLMGYKS